MASICYTHPIIPSELPFNHICANFCNSREYAMKNDDPEFVKFCQVATVHAGLDYQDTHFAIFVKD